MCFVDDYDGPVARRRQLLRSYPVVHDVIVRREDHVRFGNSIPSHVIRTRSFGSTRISKILDIADFESFDDRVRCTLAIFLRDKILA